VNVLTVKSTHSISYTDIGKQLKDEVQSVQTC